MFICVFVYSIFDPKCLEWFKRNPDFNSELTVGSNKIFNTSVNKMIILLDKSF